MMRIIPIPRRYSKSSNVAIYRVLIPKEFDMRSIVRVPYLIVSLIVLFALSAVGKASATSNLYSPPPPNVDISQRHLNESEEAIAVNPTNPNNIVVFTNIGHREAGLTAGMLLGVSFDGGTTWTTRIVGNN